MTTVVLSLLVAALLMGCGGSLVPFTHELRSEHDLRAEDLAHLQFFVSHEVTLRREARSKSLAIDGGQLELRRGKTIEEVVIEELTPGVATSVTGDAITISFGEGSQLIFSLRNGQPMPLQMKSSGGFATPPNPFPGDDATPVHNDHRFEDLVGRYYLESDTTSRVSFQGRVWEALKDSFQAHLLIDATSLEDVVEERTTLKGRTIGEGRRVERPRLGL